MAHDLVTELLQYSSLACFMAIWQLCANLLIPNCLRSNLSYSPLDALELYVKKTVSMFCRLNMEYTLVRSQYSFLANQMTERSWRCSSASIICPMCIMVLGMKKGGTIRNLSCSEVPPSTQPYK